MRGDPRLLRWNYKTGSFWVERKSISLMGLDHPKGWNRSIEEGNHGEPSLWELDAPPCGYDTMGPRVDSNLGDQIHEIHKSFKKNVLGSSLRAGHKAWRGARWMWTLSCEHY